jgi:hypothetical protein
MLHSRRKAEIEILATAPSSSVHQAELMSDVLGSPSGSTSSESEWGSTPATSQETECGLVRYLVGKIGMYMEKAKGLK